MEGVCAMAPCMTAPAPELTALSGSSRSRWKLGERLESPRVLLMAWRGAARGVTAAASCPYTPSECCDGCRNMQAMADMVITSSRYATAIVGDPAAFTAAVPAAVRADALMQKISKAAGAQNTSAPRCIASSPGVFLPSTEPEGGGHNASNTVWRRGCSA